MTPYKILGLKKTCSLEDAKKAYHRLAKKYHPDLSVQNSLSGKDLQTKMKDINHAFYVLSRTLKPSKKNAEDNIAKEKIKKSTVKPFFSFASNFLNSFIKTRKKTKKTIFKKKNSCFDDTLQKARKIKKPFSKWDYKNYDKYMEIKNAMSSHRFYKKDMDKGKLTKIEPVAPIKPITK